MYTVSYNISDPFKSRVVLPLSITLAILDFLGVLLCQCYLMNEREGLNERQVARDIGA